MQRLDEAPCRVAAAVVHEVDEACRIDEAVRAQTTQQLQEPRRRLLDNQLLVVTRHDDSKQRAHTLALVHAHLRARLNDLTRASCRQTQKCLCLLRIKSARPTASPAQSSTAR